MRQDSVQSRCSRLDRICRASQLQNTGVWRASPILVSGASAYRHGEFLYQDFLYDDHGARGLQRDQNDAREAPGGSQANGDLFAAPNPAVFNKWRRDVFTMFPPKSKFPPKLNVHYTGHLEAVPAVPHSNLYFGLSGLHLGTRP